jgi:hypothetical protein
MAYKMLMATGTPPPKTWRRHAGSIQYGLLSLKKYMYSGPEVKATHTPA